MADDKHYVPGSFYRICDRTGFKVRAGRTRKEWTGRIVRTQSFEMRQPQDFVKGVVDYQAVPDPRPRQTNRFINQDSGQPEFVVYGDSPLGASFLVQNQEGPAYNPGLGISYLNNGTAEIQDINGDVPKITAASLNQSLNRGPGSE